jgi:cytochrome c biogenesis protein CcmG/thiol:disulfide interchange protein DsbE
MTFVLNFKTLMEGILILTMTLRSARKIFPLLFLGLGAVLIAASLYFILQDIPPQSDFSTVPAKVDFPAPELALLDTESIPRSLADYHGQVVLVNLWATWCAPCKEEMPALQSFYNRYRDQGFVVIAVNDGDPTKDVLEFVEDYQLTFPVWLDPTYIATEQAFKTLTLPSSFVIDRTGTIQLQWVGGVTLKTLEKYVSPLILESQQ